RWPSVTSSPRPGSSAAARGTCSRRSCCRTSLPIIDGMDRLATTMIGNEAALSFLGVGVLPPTPSWGRTISAAIDFFETDPMYLVFPGLMLFLVTLAFNVVGDAIRDALDPRSGGAA